MSVVSVKALAEQRGGEQSFDGKIFRKSGKKSYLAACDSASDDETIIFASEDIPGLFTQHLLDATLYVKKRSAEFVAASPATSRWYWRVTIEYDNVWDCDPATLSTTPTSRPDVWKLSFAKSSRAVEEDTEGAAIINSAGDPYNPPLEADLSRPVITITTNRSSFSLANAVTLQDAINSTDWVTSHGTFAARTAKCSGVEATEQFENGSLYISITFTVELNYDTWDTDVLDQGFRYLDSNGDPQTFTDGAGQPVSEPKPLDGAGGALDLTDEANEPVYNTFALYRAVDFNTNLPV